MPVRRPGVDPRPLPQWQGPRVDLPYSWLEGINFTFAPNR